MARFAASRRDLGVRPPAASLAAGSLPQVPSGCAFHGATFPGNVASQGAAFNGEASSGGFIECRKQEIHSAVQPCAEVDYRSRAVWKAVGDRSALTAGTFWRLL